jgi:hypothetical protein
MLKRVNPYEGNLYAKLEGTSLARMQHVADALALVETLRWAFVKTRCASVK